MTGNNFRPDVVARIVQMIMGGATDLLGAIHCEHPELTALGIAHDGIAERHWPRRTA
jgi:hypothetical protein